MTEEQGQFLSAAIAYEHAKDELDKLRGQLNAALAKLPLNSYVQDPTTGLVYKVVVPQGRFVSFQHLDYVRTKKPDERQGSLSAKEAKEQGFTVA